MRKLLLRLMIGAILTAASLPADALTQEEASKLLSLAVLENIQQEASKLVSYAVLDAVEPKGIGRAPLTQGFH